MTINNNTKVTEIIIKVGVSSINFKEFLISIINENVTTSQIVMENASSDYSKLKFGSGLSSGMSSLYGLNLGGLKKIQKNKENIDSD